LWKRGAKLDSDLNKYDVEHVCAAHAKMSAAEWSAIYREAWALYYTPEHMKTLLRRAAATKVPMGSLVKLLVPFAMMVRLENIHPLQSGLFRLKLPSERRPGLARERFLSFWLGFLCNAAYKNAVMVGLIVRLLILKWSIAHDPRAQAFIDTALTPIDDNDDATLDLLTQTTGSVAAVTHIRKVAELTGAARAS
jgi:hypothetical protein